MSISFSDEIVAQKFIGLCEDVATIKEGMKVVHEVKETVDKHEKVYTIGKYAVVPMFGVAHISLKHFLSKLGW